MHLRESVCVLRVVLSVQIHVFEIKRIALSEPVLVTGCKFVYVLSEYIE